MLEEWFLQFGTKREKKVASSQGRENIVWELKTIHEFI